EPYYGTTYAFADYPAGLSHRRIYMKENGDGPGQFSWLTWSSSNKAGNAVELTNMLAGAGDLGPQFDEGKYDSATDTFTWPDSNSQPPTVNGRVVYPYKPHELNTNDWIYGNNGVSWRSDMEAALKAHIDNKDVLILPIVTPSVKVQGD